MALLHKYLNKTDFDSYEDFCSNFKLNIPEHFNFAFDVLDDYADNEPDRMAMVWCDEKDGEEYIKFGELRKRVNRTANMLKSMGIEKGDRVLLILKTRPEFWNCILALHKLGAIAVPATHMLKSKDIAYRINAGRIKACICFNHDRLLNECDKAQEATGDTLKLKICVGQPAEGWLHYETETASVPDSFTTPPKEDWAANTDTMLLYFTSGTSGYPKMVKHDFKYPLAHILTAKYWQNVIDGGLHYTVAETGWAKAVWGKLYGQWLAGSAVFIYDHDRFNVNDMLRKMKKYGVTTFCAPPTVYRFLIKETHTPEDFGRIKYCVTAGEPLNSEVYNKFLEQSGMELHEAFGQTELVVTTATWPWTEIRPGSMGKPSPGYDIELHDANDQPVPVGTEGEICLRTSDSLPPGIFGGYYLDEEMTGEAWHDGFYHTGDLAWKDADGYYWYVGRADDVIKSSGYRIGPFEVESVLMKHPAVLECAIIGVPDPTRGQVVKAFIVLANDYEPTCSLREDIQMFVKKNTAPYKYPRIVEFIDSMPKTISGKIMRSELRKY